MALADGTGDASATDTRSRPLIIDSVVVFLDVDGVLLPFGGSPNPPSSCGALFPDECLAAFSLLLEGIPALSVASRALKARVVLSSTWRVHAKYRQQILDSCHMYGRKHGGPLARLAFAGVTDVTLHSFRQAEIDDWLLRQQLFESESGGRHRLGRVAAWIALDDEDLVDGSENAPRRPFFEGRAVRTVSATGLTTDDAQAALRQLRRQLEDDSSRCAAAVVPSFREASSGDLSRP